MIQVAADPPPGRVIELRHRQRVTHPVVVRAPVDQMGRERPKRCGVEHSYLSRALAVVPYVRHTVAVRGYAGDRLRAEHGVDHARLHRGGLRLRRRLRPAPPFVRERVTPGDPGNLTTNPKWDQLRCRRLCESRHEGIARGPCERVKEAAAIRIRGEPAGPAREQHRVPR